MGKCKRRYMHGKRRRKSPLKIFGRTWGMRRAIRMLNERVREKAYRRIESMKRGEGDGDEKEKLV